MGLSGMSHCVENERKVPGKKENIQKSKNGVIWYVALRRKWKWQGEKMKKLRKIKKSEK